jgi:hypothetical protein
MCPKKERKSRMKFNIPPTLDEAVIRCTELGNIIMAREFERAAIVWAYTAPDQDIRRAMKARQAKHGEFPKVSFAKFSTLGIPGLTAHRTVREYWEVIENLIFAERALEPYEAGDEIEFPEGFLWENRFQRISKKPVLSDSKELEPIFGGDHVGQTVITGDERDEKIALVLKLRMGDESTEEGRLALEKANAIIAKYGITDEELAEAEPFTIPVGQSIFDLLKDLLKQMNADDPDDYEPEYDDQLAKSYLDTIVRHAKALSEMVNGVEFTGDCEKALKGIQSAREYLAAFEDAVNHKKENE